MDINLSQYFKSMIDVDKCAVVICDLSHTIIYMNPAARERYSKRGGAALVGQSLMDCHSPKSRDSIEKVVAWFKKSKDNNTVFTFRNIKENKDVYMVALRGDSGELIGYYEKHEYRTPETAEPYNMP